MDDDRIKRIMKMDTAALRAALETMTKEELRTIALSLARMINTPD